MSDDWPALLRDWPCAPAIFRPFLAMPINVDRLCWLKAFLVCFMSSVAGLDRSVIGHFLLSLTRRVWVPAFLLQCTGPHWSVVAG